MDQTVKRPRREITRQVGRTVIYEVPDLHDHDASLLSLERGGVQVYHSEHAFTFAVPQWINPRGHFVYVVWGENAIEDNGEDYDVLYIGMSSKILYRFAQHSLDSDWWEYAQRIETYQYTTREAALEVEQYLINSYGPLYNVHYKPVVSVPYDAERGW